MRIASLAPLSLQEGEEGVRADLPGKTVVPYVLFLDSAELSKSSRKIPRYFHLLAF
ncbi:hypothetical protein LEP1GSC047_3263 [Leptospira inadai serovar Lyme str. 10]|uniref:Uncharacterized protein n=1 Tax=Leptospira inadai serovar Lyme str. 10 TaxID=1049790 RepID=V6HBA9_9LEPT|nr:hypothetical protein LEP1GSC047_3263 [Leptospira inadai serovar Lyme str. 10]